MDSSASFTYGLSFLLIFAVILVVVPRASNTQENTPLIKGPETQYVLNGTHATFTCLAARSSRSLSWRINNDVANGRHTPVQARYESMGYVFYNNRRGSTDSDFNHTVVVPASEATNNTMLSCKILSSNNGVVESSPAKLVVLYTLRPLTPVISAENLNATVILISWYQPLIDIVTQYNILLTNSTGQYNWTILNNHNGSKSRGVWSIQRNDGENNCSIVMFQITAINEYGESEPALFTGGYPISPGTFPSDPINIGIFFHQNATLAFIALDIKFPTLCTYQSLNYTFIVKERNSQNVLRFGPTNIQYQPEIREKINSGLRRNHRYSIRVTVDTIAGSSETSDHQFSTYLMLNGLNQVDPNCSQTSVNDTTILTTQVPTSYSTKRNDSESVYRTLMYVFIGLTILAVIVVLTVCIFTTRCIRRKRGNNAHNSSSQMMVHNPIYDGPIYESILQKFGTLGQQSATTPTSDTAPLATNKEATPPTPEPTNNDLKSRYVKRPTHSYRDRANTVNYGHRSSFICDSAITNNTTSFTVPNEDQPPTRNRNKLHLTLSLGTASHQETTTVSTVTAQDDNYTVMSPAGTLGSTPSCGCGEPSPEGIMKYQE